MTIELQILCVPETLLFTDLVSKNDDSEIIQRVNFLAKNKDDRQIDQVMFSTKNIKILSIPMIKIASAKLQIKHANKELTT